MPPRHREMGGSLSGLRHLGHRRRSRGAGRGERFVDAARGRPDITRGADQLDRSRAHPPLPHRRQRTGPGARRRAGARVGDAAGGRSGRRQVDAAARGRTPVGIGPASARCICPARSRRARSGCGPSAPGARTTRSTWPPSPTCRRRSATSSGAAQPGGRRLGADHVHHRGRRRHRRRHPGARGDHGADLVCQGPARAWR